MSPVSNAVASAAASRPVADPWSRLASEGMQRLRAVFERTDPDDAPLRSFLVLVIDHSGSRARAFSAGNGATPPPPQFLGSFRSGLGEGRLRRDLALYFAEEVADGFGRLLAWKAGKAASDEERLRLADLAAAQHRLLDAIRKVVLPPSGPGDGSRR